MTGEELRRRLCEPFAAEHVEWRITKISGQSGLAVPYIDSRAIQNRLDDVVGPFCWRTRFIPWHQYVPQPGKYDKPDEQPKAPISSQLCALAIYDAARSEWIEKMDGAENTDIETIKGGISDSFKRAAVLWGVGRYLYGMDAQWAPIEKKMITPAGMTQLRRAYLDHLAKHGLLAAPDQNTANAADSIYCVSDVAPAPMQGCPNAAWIKLITPDKRELQVFYRGQKPGLAGGVRIRNACITQCNGANGQYYELQDYQPAA